MRIEVENPKEV